jgi:hypothetical protein
MSIKHLVEWELAGKPEVLGGNLPQCHSVHQKSHKTWPGIEPGPSANRLSYGTASSKVYDYGLQFYSRQGRWLSSSPPLYPDGLRGTSSLLCNGTGDYFSRNLSLVSKSGMADVLTSRPLRTFTQRQRSKYTFLLYLFIKENNRKAEQCVQC